MNGALVEERDLPMGEAVELLATLSSNRAAARRSTSDNARPELAVYRAIEAIKRQSTLTDLIDVVPDAWSSSSELYQGVVGAQPGLLPALVATADPERIADVAQRDVEHVVVIRSPLIEVLDGLRPRPNRGA